jgi:hypothetical protein
MGIVELEVMEARKLVLCPSGTKPGDVYVRVKIGDGFLNWNKTNITKYTERATWNFVSALKVKPNKSKVVYLRVHESNPNLFLPDKIIGECFVNLEELTPGERYDLWLPLTVRPSSSSPSPSSPSPSSPSPSPASSMYPNHHGGSGNSNGGTNNGGSIYREVNNEVGMEMITTGELHCLVAYFPNGKVVRDQHPSSVITATSTTTTSSIGIPAVLPSSPPPISAAIHQHHDRIQSPKSSNQLKAEQLYSKAMDEMGKFLQSVSNSTSCLHIDTDNNVNSNNNNNISNNNDNGNGCCSNGVKECQRGGISVAAHTSLKLASQFLLESLKVYRLGKSFAMLAFIFYQFDNLELTSKYLGYAEQIDPSFPVIARLRKLLVESGCRRDPLSNNQSKPDDQLSIIVVEAENIPSNTKNPSSVFCKLIIGYPEVQKETNLVSPIANVAHHEVGSVGSGDAGDRTLCFSWREFFEASLTRASERYRYGHQQLQVAVYSSSETNNASTLIGKCQPLDLFSLERDTIHDLWLPFVTTDNGGATAQVRVILNYQTGYLSDEEALSTLYNAIYCRDQVMVRSILKNKSLDLDVPFRESSSSTKPTTHSGDKLEPEYSTLVTKAARFGNLRLLKEFIQLGASVNAVDKDGFTPIMRAVQFHGIYDTLRVIRYLHSLGADLDKQNKRNYDVFSYCHTIEMRRFLQDKASDKVMYKVAVELCSKCRFLHFPLPNGISASTTIVPRDDDDHRCPNCDEYLPHSDRQEWLISKREVRYAVSAYHPYLPDRIDHYLVQCPRCTSFGFPGTMTKQHGPQLTVASDSAVIGTNHNGDERVEFPLVVAKTLWNVPYHMDSCPLASEYSLLRVWLTSDEVRSLSSILDAASPSPLAKTETSTSSVFPLENLPTELLQCVLGHLTGADVAMMECVSHTICNSASDNQFWKLLVRRDFHLLQPLPSSMDKGKKWKEIYLFYHKLYYWIKELLLEEAFYPRFTLRITEEGHVEVIIRLVARKYLFNLDGRAFTFDDEFTLVLLFSSPGTILSVKLAASGQTAAKVIELCGVMSFPLNSNITLANVQDHERKHGRISLTLGLEKIALDRWVRPYLSPLDRNENVARPPPPGFHSFLMLRDNVGGSIIMDLFYYSLLTIELEEK